ncbi:hypothetical protein [Balneola vulgaris]|uniref:hypothetical protein n=1 Tax=Balneola vulgaris TaxID=287535 RepID=UPI000368AEBD|nr:hypothetical protein [Balneola vulgaris]
MKALLTPIIVVTLILSCASNKNNKGEEVTYAKLPAPSSIGPDQLYGEFKIINITPSTSEQKTLEVDVIEVIEQGRTAKDLSKNQRITLKVHESKLEKRSKLENGDTFHAVIEHSSSMGMNATSQWRIATFN